MNIREFIAVIFIVANLILIRPSGITCLDTPSFHLEKSATEFKNCFIVMVKNSPLDFESSVPMVHLIHMKKSLRSRGDTPYDIATKKLRINFKWLPVACLVIYVSTPSFSKYVHDIRSSFAWIYVHGYGGVLPDANYGRRTYFIVITDAKHLFTGIQKLMEIPLFQYVVHNETVEQISVELPRPCKSKAVAKFSAVAENHYTRQVLEYILRMLVTQHCPIEWMINTYDQRRLEDLSPHAFNVANEHKYEYLPLTILWIFM